LEVQLAPLAQLAHKVPLVQLVLQEQLVLVQPVRVVLLVLLVQMVQLVQLDLEQPDLKVSPVLLEISDQPVLLAWEQLVQLDLWVPLVRQAQLVLEQLVQQEFQVQLGILVP
jgi:hypothetical protein